MRFITEDITDLRPCAATIGCFDGVHCGHRYLIEQVCSTAKELDLKSAIITFPVHPRQVIHTDYVPELLSCPEQKISLMRDIEADYCIIMPFTSELSQLSAKEFMKVLKDRYNVQALVVGYDHRFGHNRSESFADYCCYGAELGMEIIKALPLQKNNTYISSSTIRRSLKEGDIKCANDFLGYNYYITGNVVEGHKIGRKIGFPTANITPSCPEKLIPANGVYAVNVIIENKNYPGMLNIGNRPTLGNGNERSIEVNIFDFDKDIYGNKIQIEFIDRVRPETKFSSLEELKQQLEKDKSYISKIELKK